MFQDKDDVNACLVLWNCSVQLRTTAATLHVLWLTNPTRFPGLIFAWGIASANGMLSCPCTSWRVVARIVACKSWSSTCGDGISQQR
jgi:hypothetical protein